MNRLCLLLLFLSLGAQAVELASFPRCAGPDVPVGVLVTSYGAPVFSSDATQRNIALTRSGDRFKAVIDAGATTFTAMPSYGVVALGRLPVGTYHVDVFYRYSYETIGGPVFYPEQAAGSVDIAVATSAGNAIDCGPAALNVIGGGFQSAPLGTPFSSVVEILATDGQLRPVPFAQLDLQYLGQPYSYVSGEPTGPHAELTPSHVVTDSAGVARVSATAGAEAGTYQYVVTTHQGVYVTPTYFVLRNQAGTAQPAGGLVPVIEYYNPTLDQFFITSNFDEMRALDDGSTHDWQRTGGIFVAMPASRATLTAIGNPVCRYYGRPEAGNSSHFLSASLEECDAVGVKFAASWQFETPEAFRAFLPDLVAGTCPVGTVPVYRGFNNLPSPNHRYSLSKAMTQSMSTYLGGGRRVPWIAEGYGPDLVAMCVLE
ncbi:MAG: hypothetical protein U1F10_00520 [Burkholderiales bacterium]